MMRYLKYFVLAFSFLSFNVTLKGQDPYYTVISKSAGLPSTAIYHLFQDSRGFIWIAGNEGLTRYGGFEFKTYYNSRQTSTAGNEIKEDKYGRIWYKNFDGYLYYVENDSLHALKQNATIGNVGYAILNDKLIVMQKNGIDIFDLRLLRIDTTIPFHYDLKLSDLQYKGNYYIATDGALCKVSPTGNIERTALDAGGMMIGGKNGIMMITRSHESGYWDEITGNTVTHKFAVPNIGMAQSAAYCGGYYWLSTPNGVWAFSEEGRIINNGLPFFRDFSISSILKDRDNNYWFGTLNEGIIIVPDLNTRLITSPGFVPGKLLAVNSNLYVGTKNNEVFSYIPATGKLQKQYNGKVRCEVLCMVADTDTRKFYIAAESFTVTDSKFNVLDNNKMAVKEIVQVDKKYTAIAASGAIELMKVTNGPVSAWDSIFDAAPHSVVSGNCFLMTVGRGRTITYNPFATNIYIGSNDGLHAISPHTCVELRYKGESIYPRTLVYYKGYVYALTPQGSLYKIDTNNVIRQLTLSGERAYQIRKAGDALYLLAKGGIQMLDTVSGNFLTSGIFSNVQNEEINDIERVGQKLVISTDRGLILLNGATQQGGRAQPGFTINEVHVNGRKVGSAVPEYLTYQQNDIEIRYSILSFNTGAYYRLLYKINDGVYKKVSNATRSLRLASLAPGKYTLAFKLLDEQGNEFPVHSHEFTIEKPFWYEWWFWGCCAALFSAGAYTYYKWQTIQLKRQNALRLEKVELEKNLRNSMLTSIRAQMNPHFFYNALNTIQSFIFSDDKRNASTYLVKLSKLTRMVLEMSEMDTISLNEETEALKIYLELEKIRFNEDFNYELSIGNNVDSSLVHIPPMIVQPYVENAIKHGLLHKKGDKNLFVRFAKQDNTLCITIDDNGIGRKRAGEIASVKLAKHQSFATSANFKRIELLNKGRNQDIGIVYIDKTNDAGLPHGTTVVISIPLN